MDTHHKHLRLVVALLLLPVVVSVASAAESRDQNRPTLFSIGFGLGNSYGHKNSPGVADEFDLTDDGGMRNGTLVFTFDYFLGHHLSWFVDIVNSHQDKLEVATLSSDTSDNMLTLLSYYNLNDFACSLDMTKCAFAYDAEFNETEVATGLRLSGHAFQDTLQLFLGAGIFYGSASVKQKEKKGITWHPISHNDDGWGYTFSAGLRYHFAKFLYLGLEGRYSKGFTGWEHKETWTEHPWGDGETASRGEFGGYHISIQIGLDMPGWYAIRHNRIPD